MTTGIWHSDLDNGGFHIVGCVCSHISYHVEALKTVVQSSLNPAKAQVAENENPVEVDLTWYGFHVRIHGLPIGKMTLDIARFIGDKIGRLHTFDQAKGLESWGSFMRLRVEIDITKPLPWALKI
ncbi:UNVERIFIED_CONTAM: hypothetical protein Sangu_2445000 [Sesamum angustifolium]|uniref:Uncharacterized protein n=1 Tax=Sesamum angustifolium TaxID=2727405 RepID=A0AAW2KY95_9LAMI